jgi:PAS domain S-box-containing protein
VLTAKNPEAELVEIEQVVASSHILVVEDERLVALNLAEVLAGFGYRVTTVASGEAAIVAARDRSPDAILMDIRLAGEIDGVTAARRIREERDVPIVYLTAYSDDETLRRTMQTQPSGYLVKPFREPELRCAIEIAIHKHAIDKQLQVREQWLAAILRSIGDGLIATDPEQRVTMLNPVAEALTGWKHEEALGRALDEILKLVTVSEGAAVESPITRALVRGGITTLEGDTVLVGRTGDRVAITDSAAPIVGAQGAIVGGVMVFRKATNQRNAEQDIRELNVEIERRAVERTRKLEAANQELEAFSYSIAHDLRAPLRGIEGFSQVLIEEHAANLGPEGLAHLHRVRAAAARMASLIDDLLRMARSAMRPIESRPLDLSELAWEVIDGLRTLDAQRNVSVEIEPGLTVDGDPALLRVVLENLIGNAWKFTLPQPQPRITVGRLQHDGKTMTFVRDNGVGFDVDGAVGVFGAFQRFHLASEFEGNGLGLAIAQRIIQRHGGQIWVESSVGHGATFYFTV